MDSTIDSAIAEKVVELLTQLGISVEGLNASLIQIALNKATTTILSETNLLEIPDNLLQTAVELTLVEFLHLLSTFDPDSLEKLDLSTAVKSVKIGDTETSFATGEGSRTPEQRLIALLEHLKAQAQNAFTALRVLKW